MGSIPEVASEGLPENHFYRTQWFFPDMQAPIATRKGYEVLAVQKVFLVRIPLANIQQNGKVYRCFSTCRRHLWWLFWKSPSMPWAKGESTTVVLSSTPKQELETQLVGKELLTGEEGACCKALQSDFLDTVVLS